MKWRKDTEAPVAMTMSTVTDPTVEVERNAHGVGALLGELLIATRRISNDNLADALRLQNGSGKRIGQILVELHAIGEADLARALAEQLDLPFVDLSQMAPTQNAAELLPEIVARAQMAVPVSSDDAGVTVAVCEPSLELISVLEGGRQTADPSRSSTPLGCPTRHRHHLSDPGPAQAACRSFRGY